MKWVYLFKQRSIVQYFSDVAEFPVESVCFKELFFGTTQRVEKCMTKREYL